MVIPPVLLSLLLILLISALLVVSGLKKQPGIGIIAALIVIALAVWLRREPLVAYGFAAPTSWLWAVLLGLLFGLLIQLLAVVLIEPLSEKLTHSTHDHSILDNVKGSWKAFLQWMLMVWILVALLEEALYRGFLMTETARVIGNSTAALLLNILFSSIVFGLSHGYQARAGILSTAAVGVLLGCIFAFSDFNLWLAVFTHGFIDTFGIAFIALGWDKTIRRILWKSAS